MSPHGRRVAVITPLEEDVPVQVSAYKAWMPRYGSVPVAQAIKDAGFEVRHYCEHSGSVIDWDYVLSCDYVCFSLMTFCAHRGYRYARHVRSRSNAVIIFGGCHASVAAEDCLGYCDYVVRNEGEEAVVELLHTLEGGGDPTHVLGISMHDDGNGYRHNPDRSFMRDLSREVDLSVIDGYPRNTLGRFVSEPLKRGHLPRISLPVAQTSRGCVHRCRFCMVRYELGSEYRRRPPEVVVREVRQAFDFLRSRTIFLVDNDFTHRTDHALAILEPLIRMYKGHFNIYFFSRVDLARKPDLLEALSRIDNVYIGVGFESTNDQTLSQFCKGQRESDFEESVRTLHSRGFNIHGLFIFGADADTVDSLGETVRFAVKNKLYTVGFSALYDVPGKERSLGLPQLIPDHRFIHRDWRLFTGHFVVFFPKLMRPSQLQRVVVEGQRRFFRENRDTFFQYFPVYASSVPYLRYLEKAEMGLYDSSDRLIEERLRGRAYEDLVTEVPISASRLVQGRETVEFLLQNASRPKAWRMLASNFSMSRRRRGEPGFSGNLPILEP
jgi:anaerobic magnesium-protoporphyrin IX monomethyl ester cyclase